MSSSPPRKRERKLDVEHPTKTAESAHAEPQDESASSYIENNNSGSNSLKRGESIFPVASTSTHSVFSVSSFSSSPAKSSSNAFSAGGGGGSYHYPYDGKEVLTLRRSSSSDIVVEKRGVKLSLLKRILEVCNSREIPFERVRGGEADEKIVANSWSIEAVTNIVIGAHELKDGEKCRWFTTSDGRTRCNQRNALTCLSSGLYSLIDLLMEHHSFVPHPELKVTYDQVVGEQANLFVSLAYKGSFSDLLDAIENYMEEAGLKEDETYLWYDPVVNNQWDVLQKSAREWCTTFKKAIKDIKHTVAILTPWNDPYYFKRLWCLVEFAVTIESGQKLGIGMSKKEKESFIDGFVTELNTNTAHYSIYDIYKNINASKATCFQETDEKDIRSVIENTSGYYAIEKCVFENIRAWMLSTMENYLHYLEEHSPKVWNHSEKALLLRFAVSKLYYLQGNYTTAALNGKNCWNRCIGAFGDSHQKTLAVMSFYADCVSNSGDNSAAIELSKTCYEKQSQALGEDHADTLSTLSNRAWYIRVVDIDLALSLGGISFEKRKGLLGPSHLDTISSMHRMAGFYYFKGDHENAILFGNECLTERQRVLGTSHPDTLSSMNNLSLYYLRVGKIDKALTLGHNCLDIKKQVLGEMHPQTLTSIDNLAKFYKHNGNYDKSISLGKDCLEKRRKVLGECHPDSIMSLNNLSAYYFEKGYFETSINCIKDCLDKCKAKLGTKHPDTLMAHSNFACSLREKGDLEAAIAFGNECLIFQKEALDEKHPQVLESQYNLAISYLETGNFAEARRLLEAALLERQQKLDEPHSETLQVSLILALTLYEQGEVESSDKLFVNSSLIFRSNSKPRNGAILLMERTHKVRSRLLGDSHPLTLKSQNYISILKEKLML